METKPINLELLKDQAADDYEKSKLGEVDENKYVEEKIKQIQKAYQEIVRIKGVGYADRKMRQIQKDPLDENRTIFKSVEQATSKSEAIKIAIKKLIEQGFLEKLEEENGLLVADIDKFKNDFKIEKYSLTGPLFNSKYFARHNPNKFLTLLFEGVQVVSKEDYKRGTRKTKSLFYFPKNKRDALDVNKIKKSDFYLTLFETTKTMNFDSATNGSIPNDKEEYGGDPENGLDYREVILPVLIYHPNYGDGYRDPKTGNLYIRRDDMGGEYGKFSGEYLKEKYMSNFGSTIRKENISNPRELLRLRMPRLIEHDLLRPDDFRIISGSSTAENMIESKRIGERGGVMFNRMVHIIHNKFDSLKALPGVQFLAYKIDPHTGWVVEVNNGKRRLRAEFTIYDKDEKFRTKEGNYSVRTGDVRMIEMENFEKRQEWESEEEFERRQERRKILETIFGVDENSFDKYLEIAEYLAKEVGINITKLDIEYQQLILNIAKKHNLKDNHSLKEFIKKYGMDGLKTFLSVEHDQSLRDKIFEIGEKINQFAARSIFRKYSELASLACVQEEEIKQEFKDGKKTEAINIDKVRCNFLERPNKLLIEISRGVASGKYKGDVQSTVDRIIERLDLIQRDMIFSAEVFKGAVKRGERMESGEAEPDIEDIIGSQFEELPAAAIYDQDKKVFRDKKTFLEMQKIYAENYKDRPKLQKALLKSHENKLKENGGKTRIFTYHLRGKLVAFCRFDMNDDGIIYFGAMNIHPEIKGKAMGTSFIEKAFKAMSQRGEIVGECIPAVDISSWYLREQGFVVDQIVDETAENNYASFDEPMIFHIKREQNPPRYGFKKEKEIQGEIRAIVDPKEILTWYSQHGSEELDGKRVLAFPIKRKVSRDMYPVEMRQQLRELINERGYVMTGYVLGKSNREDEQIAYCALERSVTNGSN